MVYSKDTFKNLKLPHIFSTATDIRNVFYIRKQLLPTPLKNNYRDRVNQRDGPFCFRKKMVNVDTSSLSGGGTNRTL